MTIRELTEKGVLDHLGGGPWKRTAVKRRSSENYAALIARAIEKALKAKEEG